MSRIDATAGGRRPRAAVWGVVALLALAAPAAAQDPPIVLPEIVPDPTPITTPPKS